MKASVKILLIIILSVGVHRVQAQGHSAIRVIVSAQQDSIIVRWAPNDPVSWKYLNQHGYRVERYTIVRDGAVLQQKPMTLLAATIKPAQENSWLRFMNDDMIALQAQCIFGESFSVQTNNSLLNVTNQLDELQSRYSYSVLAADISPKSAQLAGLQIVDHDVRQNERYLYRVYSLVPKNILEVEFGFAYIGPTETIPLPQPKNLAGSVRANRAVLRYDPNPLREFYSAYFVERKDSLGQFVQVNKFPLLPILTDTIGGQTLVVSDSLPQNNWRYEYRLRGISPFGQFGPYSNIATLKNFTLVSLHAPSVKDLLVTSQNSVVLAWSVTEEEKENVSGFEIMRASKEGGSFVKIHPALLPAAARSYEDKQPLPTNYYKIASIARTGKQRVESFPFLVQLEDSIPPSAPQKLTAVVDTSSVVKLKWSPNTERDLIGYRVYYSNFKSAEFSQITSDPVQIAEFTDTLSSNTLSRKGYYKVAAVDNRFNTSNYSDIIEIVRPDKIPPVPPVVTGIKNSTEGIQLMWNRSSSEDVVKQELRRKCDGEEWTILKTFTNDTAFLDKSAPINKNCQYKLNAVDDSGLSSLPSSIVTGRKQGAADKGKIEQLFGQADRENRNVAIQWRAGLQGVVKYLIYRAEGESALSLYKTISGSAVRFVDVNVTMNTTYIYRIKAVFETGNESSFSEQLIIRF